MPDADDAEDLALLEEAAAAAGALALSFWGKDPRSWTKGAQSPVSEADLAVDRLLAERLQKARPHYGWLSEETADSDIRLRRRRVFVVDPIDGTRAFLARSPEWMVSLAVVDQGRPVAAALVAPVLGDVYTACLGRGARKNGRVIRASTTAQPAQARVAGGKAQLERPLPTFAEIVPRVPSLALRFARVSDGTLDAAFAAAAAHDWDVAGVDLVLTEAGARLTALDGTTPVYNRRVSTHPSLMAAGEALHTRLQAHFGPEGRQGRGRAL